jgi:outer membrane protein assembly factor BamB
MNADRLAPCPRHRFRTTAFCLSLAACWCLSSPAFAAHWSNWRGPNGNGIAVAKNLPDGWSLDSNIRWKTALPSWSGSSPVVWGDKVFVISPAAEQAEVAQETGAADNRRGGGREAAVSGPGGQELFLFCLSRADGSVLWHKSFDYGNRMQRKANSSSPSPVTDGEHVWVISGNAMVVAFDMEGNQKWYVDLVKEYGPIGTNFGYNSSPLIVDGKLIVQMLRGGRADGDPYLLALDGATGKVVWRVTRPTEAVGEGRDGYTTPALAEIDGKKQIVVSGSNYVTGHDLETGKELWRSTGLNPRNAGSYRIVPSPSVVAGIVYAPTRRTPLIALKAGGEGDVTESNRLWEWTGGGAPDVPTPVCDGTYYYMVDDGGQVTCLDARKGTLVWGPEDSDLGRVSASPVIADGRIYVLSETAETAVFETGGAFKPLGKHALDGSYTLSSPAIDGEEIFIRTASHLYCIGK